MNRKLSHNDDIFSRTDLFPYELYDKLMRVDSPSAVYFFILFFTHCNLFPFDVLNG